MYFGLEQNPVWGGSANALGDILCAEKRGVLPDGRRRMGDRLGLNAAVGNRCNQRVGFFTTTAS